MIQIHNLPFIKSPEQFFNTEKVVFVDILPIDDLNHPEIGMLLLNSANSFVYEGKTFYLLILKGSPENLILNAKRGAPLLLANGNTVWMHWQLKLREAIADKKIYDVSKYQHTAAYSRNVFDFDMQILIQQYQKELSTYES